MKKQFTILLSIIISFFSLFAFINRVYAETEVSGNITSDTTWTLTDSPYHIIDTVSVYPGTTLTIEPGVIIKADSGKYLQIAGTLTAIGEPNNLIIFTSYQNGGSWGGLKFIDSAEDAEVDENYNYINGSIIKYADVNSGLDWDCIKIEGSSPFISNSEIHNCKNGIFVYNYNYSDSSNAIIYSNLIYNIPTGYGVQQTNKVNDIGIVKIVKNTIYNVGTGVITKNGQGPYIKDNTIRNNKNGISIEASKDFLAESNFISILPTSQESSVGINIKNSSTGKLKYNGIINQANVQPSNSSLSIYNSNVTVQSNTITSDCSATVRVNCLNTSNCSTIELNNIYNTYSGNYAIWNWGGSDVGIQNNYLGTTNLSEINNKIYDYYDNPSLGKINYQPYATAEQEFVGSNNFDWGTTCTSWTYSDWSTCSTSGQQTRSIISSSPNNCTGGNPVLTQSCTYIPSTCTSWTYSDWSTCSSNNQQSRNVISSSPSGCTGGNPVLNQSCTYTLPTSTCSSWTYSNWGACSNGQQTRNIISSQPAGCSGGSPVLSQSCNSTPTCAENDWSFTLSPTACPASGQQTKIWSKIGQCQNGTSHSSEETVSCDYQTPTCSAFIYSDWSTCSSSGVQTRTVMSATPANCAGGNPAISQSCQYETESEDIATTNDSQETEIDNNSNNDNQTTENETEASNNTISKTESISKEVIAEEKTLITKIDSTLSKRVSGNILLQVEKNGEGWYVYPDNKKKYYLGRPADAFSIMRNLGLGIKHSELAEYLKSKFPSRLSGKILLDVEQNGEAYYVNPNDLKGYYLNRPADAFRIMREQGLGITNTDIRKIDVGEIQ